MDFRKLINLCETMSQGEARQIFFTNGVNPDDLDDKGLKSAYRRLMMKHHPDMQGGDTKTAQQISVAYETLKSLGSSPRDAAPKPQNRDTKSSSGFSMDNPRFSHIDYVKWYFDQLTQGSSAQSWTVMNFDGRFFRGMFTIRATADLFPKVAEVMQEWDDQYNSIAIMVGTNQMLDRGTIAVINIMGREVKPMVTLQFDSFNRNPANDQQFCHKLPQILDDIADGTFVSQDMMESVDDGSENSVRTIIAKGQYNKAPIELSRRTAGLLIRGTRTYRIKETWEVTYWFDLASHEKWFDTKEAAEDYFKKRARDVIRETVEDEDGEDLVDRPVIFKSNWIDSPHSNSFHRNGRGFSNYPGIYLCRVGSNSAYGNHKGGFPSREAAQKYLDDHDPIGDWKITEVK